MLRIRFIADILPIRSDPIIRISFTVVPVTTIPTPSDPLETTSRKVHLLFYQNKTSPTLHAQSLPPHLRSPPPSSSKSLVTLCIGPILVAMLRISTPDELNQREPERVPND